MSELIQALWALLLILACCNVIYMAIATARQDKWAFAFGIVMMMYITVMVFVLIQKGGELWLTSALAQ